MNNAKSGTICIVLIAICFFLVVSFSLINKIIGYQYVIIKRRYIAFTQEIITESLIYEGRLILNKKDVLHKLENDTYKKHFDFAFSDIHMYEGILEIKKASDIGFFVIASLYKKRICVCKISCIFTQENAKSVSISSWRLHV